jgi:tripeptide aminopeptidase
VLTRDASTTELFLELVGVPSPSGDELRLGTLIRDWLGAAGVAAEFDASGAQNGSDAGNLIAIVPGAAGAPAYLFVAHMDTVESGVDPVRPRLDEDGVIRSESDTILGADNKSAVAAVMQVCRAVAQMDAARRPTLVAAFTCREESGRMGASLLDLSERPIDSAFSVDGSKPIGTVITRALGQSVFTVAIRGRAAHAAANPEAGVSAIRVAADVIAALPLGRRPGGGSVSVAAIVGGAVVDRLSPGMLTSLGVGEDADGPTAVAAALSATPTNSVPDTVAVRGEVRGYSEDDIEDGARAVEDVVARVCGEHGAQYEWARDRARVVPPMPARPASRALALVRGAVAGLEGIELVEEEAQATLEANYLAAHTDVVALASGGRDPHQTSESITTAELDQLEALLLRIVELGSVEFASTPEVA